MQFGFRTKGRAQFLKQMKDRAEELKKDNKYPIDIRSQYLEWNYDAELYAFSKRLKEDFNENILREAFIDSSYMQQEKLKLEELKLESDKLELKDNSRLSETGITLIHNFASKYLTTVFPLLPIEGVRNVADYLTSGEVLSYIGKELGFRDLILIKDYPPSDNAFAVAVCAVVACLNHSSGLEKCHKFILDFVITQLNGKSLWDMWRLENPLSTLNQILSQGSKEVVVEPRLIGDLGKNTIESVFYVGLYDETKKLIGKGYGESIDIAVKVAAYDALEKKFQFSVTKKPIPINDFDVTIVSKLTNP